MNTETIPQSFRSAVQYVHSVLEEHVATGKTSYVSREQLESLKNIANAIRQPNAFARTPEQSFSSPTQRPSSTSSTPSHSKQPEPFQTPAFNPTQRQTTAPTPTIDTSAASHTPLVAESGSKIDRLNALRDLVIPCQKCPALVSFRSQVVFGIGNPDATVMLVGEAPGAEEDRLGEPFVGAAGELLNKILQAMGIPRDSVFIANVLKCRPDIPLGTPGNRKPTAAEMDRCLPYLREQISIVSPKVIIALGATAMQGLFGKVEAMARLRSRWYTFHNIPVMATYHPSYLLHNQSLSEKRKVWEDMLKVMEHLGMPISDKQRGFFLKSTGANS